MKGKHLMKIKYNIYINSQEWKDKRFTMLLPDETECYCCNARKWHYRIWKCNRYAQDATYPHKDSRYSYRYLLA